MSLSYELRVHSRNVDALGTAIGSHTGYDLITKDETGKIINIQSVDLIGTSPINGSSYFTEYSSSQIIQVGDTIAPNKIFKDGIWHDVDSTWIENNNYKSFNVPVDSNNARDIFNKIRVFSELTNSLYTQGLKFDY